VRDLQRDSDDFRAGVAYAGHVLLHSIGHAHGEQDRTVVASAEPKRCCQDAVLVFALGMASGLNADRADEHDHTDSPS
jgi:hypothetical protein